MEGRLAMPVIKANTRISVVCVSRVTLLSVKSGNTGNVVFKSHDSWMPLASDARGWRTRSSHLTADTKTVARGSVRRDFYKIAGQMSAKGAVQGSYIREYASLANPVGSLLA